MTVELAEPTPVTLDGTIRLTVALNLRRLRAAKSWSQEMLAHFADLHPTEISRMERALRSARVTTLARVAIALGVEVGELLAPIEGYTTVADAHDQERRRAGGGGNG